MIRRERQVYFSGAFRGATRGMRERCVWWRHILRMLFP